MPPLAGIDVCLPRHVISLILPSLGVMLRILTALHLPVAHIDDITRPIAICNDTYKFVAYSYSILQEFTVDSKVMVTSHPKARKLLAWRAYFDRILKSASIAYELDNLWDPDINSVFSKDDTPLSTIGALIKLPSFTADLSQRPVSPPPSWSRCDALVLILRPLP